MPKNFQINGRVIGPGHQTYIIAELSANHHHSLERAIKHLEAAKAAGADAVKLQTYTPDTMTIDCDAPPFQIKGTQWDGRTLYDLYAEAFTPWEWHHRLKAVADDLGLDLFSTPFDATAVDFLSDLGVPAFKVASFELVDVPLLRRVARTGKPMIVSTGMSTLGEIEEAVAIIRGAGGEQLALLKCTSAYPSPPEAMNLRTIPNMAEAFQVPVGLSDHSLELAVPVAAVTLGACILEKHFILSRSEKGPDSAFSLEPAEFKAMVDAVRATEKALGKVSYGVDANESENRVFRRSLFAVQDIKAGDVFSEDNVRSIRPGHGLHPRHFDEVIGRAATQDIPRGTPMDWHMVR